MKEPNIEQMKLDMGLPKNTFFHGFLIHNPEQDDFLLSYKSNRSENLKAYCQTPDMAFRFMKFKKAYKALQDLEIEERAIIVAAFDLNNQILIVGPDAFKERLLAESNNPFRANEVSH